MFLIHRSAPKRSKLRRIKLYRISFRRLNVRAAEGLYFLELMRLRKRNFKVSYEFGVDLRATYSRSSVLYKPLAVPRMSS